MHDHRNLVVTPPTDAQAKLTMPGGKSEVRLDLARGGGLPCAALTGEGR